MEAEAAEKEDDEPRQGGTGVLLSVWCHRLCQARSERAHLEWDAPRPCQRRQGCAVASRSAWRRGRSQWKRADVSLVLLVADAGPAAAAARREIELRAQAI